MKQFTLLLRVLLSICSILMVTLCLHSSLLAQTKNKATPGTFASLPAHISSKSITSAATVTGLQQFYSSTGHYTISADGIGSLNASMTIRVNKPNAQATVQKAILVSSVTFGTINDGCVTIAGVPVNWNGTAATAVSTYEFNNYWADVTSIVASTINAFPSGTSTLPITECSTGMIEGEALLVVFNDPTATEKTIIVILGAEDPQGDNFSVTLAKPIDPNATGALLDMGLGIGYSYQFGGSNQASQVSVNSQRISSSAGGEDDGESANGALITVGGIGDLDDNPSDPFALPTNPRSDDELYSILPFITNTTTGLTINTINPSLDDNIFLAYFVTSGAAVVGEGILLSQTSDTGNVGDQHTVKAAVVNSLGQPITGRVVTFTVTSGPNAGNTFSATTDASGNASYTYTGTGGVGTDSIQACFTSSQSQTSCSNTLAFTWIQANQNTPPFFDYPPTPTDGTTYNVTVGQNVTFTVKAEDSDGGDNVTLTATGLPAGATTSLTKTGSAGLSNRTAVTSILPASGNPVTSTFSWTPTTSDVGTYVVQYVATDNAGISATTNIIISVSSVSTCDSTLKVHVAGVPRYTVKGQAYHTIYKGYGLQRLALFAAHSGGTAPYTYQWSDGATSYIHIVSPDSTTTYGVTITDAKGCTATCSVTIYVVDVRCTTAGNIYVCNGGQTMSVAKKDVQGWLDQGAKLGQCSIVPLTAANRTTSVMGLKPMASQAAGAFSIYPNPAVSSVTLKWNTVLTGSAKVVITDLQGRILMTQSVSGSSKTISVSQFASGVYMAKLVTADKTIATSRFVVSK